MAMTTQIRSTSFGCNVQSFKPAAARVSAPRAVRVVSMAAVAGEVPDREKRNIMNLLLAGAVGLPVAGLAGPYALFFVPKRCDHSKNCDLTAIR